MRDPVKNKALKLLACQASGTVFLAIVAWIVYGGVAAYSALLGGTITFLSSSVFFSVSVDLSYSPRSRGNGA